MNTALWSKLSILGAVAAVGGACAISACTVTDGPLPSDDAGTTDSSTTDGGGGADVVAQDVVTNTDAGTDAGTCGPRLTCPVLATQNITLDNDGVACEACDDCMATKCCSEVTTCFTPDDSGTADCREELDCIAACNTSDAGAACVDTCRQAHATGDPQAIALDNCRTTNCAAQCP